MANTYYARI